MIPLRAPARVLLVITCALTSGLAAPATSARPYAPAGVAITGGDDSGSAVPLDPGQYRDRLSRGSASLGEDGSVRYYAITVRRGERPSVAATLAAPGPVTADGRLEVSVSLTAPGESSPCATDDASDDNYDDRLSAVTAVVTPAATGSADGCPAGTLVARVARGGDLAIDDPLPVELAYRREPAATASGTPATASDALRPQLTGRPAALASGAGFATAPVVPTGSYRDTLTADDIRIVRVRLGWGQRLAWSFTSAKQPGVQFGDGLDVVATVRNPVRELVDQASGSRTSTTVASQDGALNGATPAPVRYVNRDSDDPDVAACAVAGDWFLVLGVDHPSGDPDPGLRVPYTLQVQVFGTAGPGPAYRLPDGATAAPDTAAPTASSRRTGYVAAGLAVLAGVLVIVAVTGWAVRRRAQRRVHT